MKLQIDKKNVMMVKNSLFWLPALVALLSFSSCRIFNGSAGITGASISGSDDTSLVIAFGSCNHHDDPQTIWEPILQNDPDLWIWLGDNVYGDTDDMQVLETKYNLQKKNEAYRHFRAAVPVIGVWDDHDYGRNDAGKGYPYKKESMQLALDFLGEPENSPRRKQSGIYAAYNYTIRQTRVKVILLDARYNRDTLLKEGKRYIPDPHGDFLGEEQWAWLEDQLNESDADIHIIGSGIQFIPDQHPYEKWANFPTARERLFKLIASSGVRGVIFISGDRHIAEISKKEIEGVGYPVYEVTASGLTHSSVDNTDEINPYRVGPLVNQKNFGIIRIVPGKDRPKVQLTVKGEENKLYASESIVF